MRPKPAHPVQEDFDVNFYLFIYCNFEVFSFILVLENKRDCSPHK